MSLAFIEFEARILGLSLETKIFLIRNTEERKKERNPDKVLYRGVLAHCLKSSVSAKLTIRLQDAILV